MSQSTLGSFILKIIYVEFMLILDGDTLESWKNVLFFKKSYLLILKIKAEVAIKMNWIVQRYNILVQF